MTDQVTSAYNAAAGAPGSDLRHVMDAVRANPGIPTWKRPYPPRPIFVEERRVRAFADDLMRMLDLLTSLPERLFDGDLDRFCDAIGVHGDRRRLMQRHAADRPVHFGRADVYDDGAAFKLLEFGIGSDLGGWCWAGEVPRALLEVEPFAAFAQEHGLGYVHTGHETVRTIREFAAEFTGGREPMVALIEAPGGLGDFGGIWHNFHRVMRSLGLDFHLGELTDIEERDGALHLDGRRIDVVWRAFDTDQLLESPEHQALAEPVFRAYEQGQVLLWTTLQTNLFGEKACMALLSDPRWSGKFSAQERELIDRVLPWTRSLQGGEALDDTELADRIRTRRASLVLKPNNLYGGHGVVAGWEVDDEQWWQAVTEGAAGGCVVQERVVPKTELMVDPADGALRPWQTLWGVFYQPDGYAGAHARMIPAESSAIIGFRCMDRIHTGSVFHF
ncbi:MULTISPECIES: hypothetical protein [Streptomyces]|uniref:hypothetical protein n=1 Tax=Streptomyces TaxID=1883 RepID=UPI0007C7524B|nr:MULTISPECIES: hypothetical protein [Streptomyces]